MKPNASPAPAIRERPILFSGPMVSAILVGTKTQTRRTRSLETFNEAPGEWIPEPDVRGANAGLWRFAHRGDRAAGVLPCPYGKRGEHLWVRETWCHKHDDNGCVVYNADRNLDPSCCWYAADGGEITAQDGDGFTRYRKDGTEASPWTPSIHMPRWACRIVLEITDVRVERLQAISDSDAKAEGVVADGRHGESYFPGIEHVVAYGHLWDAINGAGAWDANPWVWALTFRRVMP